MKKDIQRAKELDKDIAAGKKTVAGILQKSQRSVNGTIKEFTSAPNYMTSAVLRNKLYTQLAGEYKTLNAEVDVWIKSGAESTSKKWWQHAKEDLPKGTVKGTFGAFSEK